MAWRVLIVDDDPLIRRALCLHLRRRGMQATALGAAEPALEALREHAFDLVVTDVILPGRSGLWLLAEVRRREHRLPVILVTGWYPDRTQLDAYRAADAVLLKPLRTEELVRRITRILASRDDAPDGPDARAAE